MSRLCPIEARATTVLDAFSARSSAWRSIHTERHSARLTQVFCPSFMNNGQTCPARCRLHAAINPHQVHDDQFGLLSLISYFIKADKYHTGVRRRQTHTEKPAGGHVKCPAVISLVNRSQRGGSNDNKSWPTIQLYCRCRYYQKNYKSISRSLAEIERVSRRRLEKVDPEANFKHQLLSLLLFFVCFLVSGFSGKRCLSL